MSGRYDIVRRLGSTSFGDVFLAVDAQGNHVDIELVHRQHARGLDLEILREAVARSGRASDGVGIPMPIGLTNVHGRAGVVTVHAGGVPLSTLMSGKPWPVKAALQLIERVGGTLEHAWDIARLGPAPLRWAHGDLHPEVIRVLADGTTRLMGFGYEAALHPGSEELDMDSTGTFVSLAYLAPERLSGGFSSGVDKYALGVLLLELLSGVRQRTATAHSQPDAHAKRVEQMSGALRRVLGPGNDGVLDLVEDLLSHDPLRRPSRHAVVRTVSGLADGASGVGLDTFAAELVPDAEAALHASAEPGDRMVIGAVASVVDVGPPTEDSTLWETPEPTEERMASGGVVGLDVPPDVAEAERRQSRAVNSAAFVAVLMVAIVIAYLLGRASL